MFDVPFPENAGPRAADGREGSNEGIEERPHRGTTSLSARMQSNVSDFREKETSHIIVRNFSLNYVIRVGSGETVNRE